MYDSPALTDFTMPVIHVDSTEAIGTHRMSTNLATPASAVWSANNQAVYVPFAIPETATFTRGLWYNGATVSGNADVGIYDLAGNRLASSGATAQATINVVQVAAFTAAVTLTPGRYYMAFLSTTTVATFFAHGATLLQRMFGCYTEAVGAGALPATATFATWTSRIMPMFGISQQGF